MTDTVELGVALLASLDDDSLSLPEALDRLEVLTTEPAHTRAILDTAEKRGLVERTDGRLAVQSGTSISTGSDVIVREGEYTCRRCGADLSAGHFLDLDAGELGPFGPTCVRYVIGRE